MSEIEILRNIALMANQSQTTAELEQEQKKVHTLDTLGDKYMPKVIDSLKTQAQKGSTSVIEYVRLDDFSKHHRLTPRQSPKCVISEIIRRWINRNPEWNGLKFDVYNHSGRTCFTY